MSCWWINEGMSCSSIACFMHLFAFQRGTGGGRPTYHVYAVPGPAPLPPPLPVIIATTPATTTTTTTTRGPPAPLLPGPPAPLLPGSPGPLASVPQSAPANGALAQSMHILIVFLFFRVSSEFICFLFWSSEYFVFSPYKFSSDFDLLWYAFFHLLHILS